MADKDTAGAGPNSEQDSLDDTATPKDNSTQFVSVKEEPQNDSSVGLADVDTEMINLSFLDDYDLPKIMSYERWQELYDDASKQGAEQTSSNPTEHADSGSATTSMPTCTSEEAMIRFLSDSQGWQEYMARLDGATDAFATIDPKLLQSTANKDTDVNDEPTATIEEPTEPSAKSKGKEPMQYDADGEADLPIPPELLKLFANVPSMNYIPCQNCHAVAQVGYHTFPSLIDMLIPPHFFLAYSGAQDDYIAMLKPLLSLMKACIAQSAAAYVKAQRAADHDTMQRISGELVNQVRPAMTGVRVALEQYFECCFKDTPELRAVVMTALTDPEIGPNDWISAHHP